MTWDLRISIVFDDEEIEDDSLTALHTAGDTIRGYLQPLAGIKDVRAYAFKLYDGTLEGP